MPTAKTTPKLLPPWGHDKNPVPDHYAPIAFSSVYCAHCGGLGERQYPRAGVKRICSCVVTKYRKRGRRKGGPPLSIWEALWIDVRRQPWNFPPRPIPVSSFPCF